MRTLALSLALGRGIGTSRKPGGVLALPGLVGAYEFTAGAQSFDDTARLDPDLSTWIETGVTEASGTVTATAGGTTHEVSKATVDVGVTAFEVSCVATYVNHAWLAVGNATDRAWFDIQNGVAGSTTGDVVGSTITASGGGYKCSVFVRSDAAATIALAPSDGASTFSATGTEAVALSSVYGRQLQLASSPNLVSGMSAQTQSAAATRPVAFNPTTLAWTLEEGVYTGPGVQYVASAAYAPTLTDITVVSRQEIRGDGTTPTIQALFGGIADGANRFICRRDISFAGISVSVAMPIGGPDVFAFTRAADGTHVLRRNGAVVRSGNIGTNVITGVSTTDGVASAARALSGQHERLLVFDRVLTTDELLTVEAAMAAGPLA